MNDYSFINHILNAKFLVKNQFLLEERQGNMQPHEVAIRQSLSNIEYKLYKFDENPYPFFSSGSSNSTPKLLQSFCDYVMVVNRDDTCTIMLIELKRGMDSATHQLRAADAWLNFVLETAERIKGKNNYKQFNRNNIHKRLIAIYDKARKRKTSSFIHPRNIDESEIVSHQGSSFSPSFFLWNQ
jgi:small nuclear ribonucleoprotein (snRNP)-like protein